ncbi:MAG: hypothetical protein QY327_08465 [Fimbriimonadaceae bacterium]|nr:MAG: hypothetical protein QY327_08465 [Fimbriimonadaceae bacterium]
MLHEARRRRSILNEAGNPLTDYFGRLLRDHEEALAEEWALKTPRKAKANKLSHPSVGTSDRAEVRELNQLIA